MCHDIRKYPQGNRWAFCINNEFTERWGNTAINMINKHGSCEICKLWDYTIRVSVRVGSHLGPPGCRFSVNIYQLGRFAAFCRFHGFQPGFFAPPKPTKLITIRQCKGFSIWPKCCSVWLNNFLRISNAAKRNYDSASFIGNLRPNPICLGKRYWTFISANNWNISFHLQLALYTFSISFLLSSVVSLQQKKQQKRSKNSQLSMFST